MTDIVIAACPYVDTLEPIMAPALLKPIAVNQGYSCVALDLNFDFLQTVKQLYPTQLSRIADFFTSFSPDPEIAPIIATLIEMSADNILKHNPKIVALSLLTSHSQIFTKWLCMYLKLKHPSVRIVIGGTGIKDLSDTSMNKSNVFCNEMLSLGLIDHYIYGDGEIAFEKYLQGDYSYPGINSNIWIQPLELDQFLEPDYSDYHLTEYPMQCIPITDSRGCVRDCEFCDVIEHWKKYVYRSAESVFKEMLHQIKKHNLYHFSMRNSLTNGNVKEFKRWLDLIIDYNSDKPKDKQISWSGFFIVREPSQHPEELWEKISKSNGYLFLGVESVIKHVRWAMRKKFSDEAIDWHLEMGQKYKVPMRLLMIVASPQETLADYEYTKQWFLDRLHYASNPVVYVALSMASILPGTAWDRKKEEYGISTGAHPPIWFNQNLRITAEQKLKHFQELTEIVKAFDADIQQTSKEILPTGYAKPRTGLVTEQLKTTLKLISEQTDELHN